MSRKSFFVLFFVALLTAGYVARGPLVSQFFQWYLKGYCRECLGSRLSYESVRHDGSRWIFDNPVLTTQKRLEKGGYSCQAEKATIEVSISWMRRSLNLDVAVESPHIDIGTAAEDLRAILGRPVQTFGLFNVHTSFNVPQGTILVHDFNEDHLVPVPLFFSIDFTCRQKKDGCMSLWLGDPSREDRDFLAVFSQNDIDRAQLSLNFSNVDCPPLQQIFRGLCPELTALEMRQGVLGGRVVLSFPREGDFYAEGLVVLKDLVARHSESGSEVRIPALKLQLTPRDAVSDEIKTINTFGVLESLSGDIEVRKGEETFWSIKDIVSTVSFKSGDFARFSINGNVDSPLNRRTLNLEGRGRFAEKGQTSLTIDARLTGVTPEEETAFHFSARQLGEHWSFGEVEISGFGREELALIQHLGCHPTSQVHELQITKGNIDAAALVYLKGLHLSEVKVERVAANGLEFIFPPWNLSGNVLYGVGSLSFDLFAEEPINTFNADLNIREASLNLGGLEKAKWEFSSIHTDLSISNGIIQESSLKGTIAGLNGEVVLDGTKGGPIAIFDFEGMAADIAKVLPEVMKKGIEKEFKDDELHIIAEVTKLSEGLQFNGKLIISEETPKEKKITFGFSLEKSPTGLWHRWPPHPLVAEYCPGAGLEAMHLMSPSLAMPINIVYSHLIKQKLGFGAFGIKNGWFHAESLPLEKYLSPFIFNKNQMQLSGCGDFHGDCDGQKLIVHYDARDMVVKNADFSAEIPWISQTVPYEIQVTPTFVFDFDKQTSFNSFPIYNGTYFEKNSGLLFTEVNAIVSMENDTGHLSNLTTFCNGLYFEGAIDLDWSMPGDGVFDVTVNMQQMHGKASHVRHFLSHLNKNIMLLKMPLEGNVALQRGGAKLLFSFQEDGYTFETKFPGRLTDGTIGGQNVDMSLQELSFNFEYDHSGNTLGFTDIQATVLIGKSHHIEEYALAGDKVSFTDYQNNAIDFDLWLGDKMRNIVRLAGTTSSQHSGNADSIVFNFDKTLSHFGNVHPAEFELALKDWSQITNFRLEFDFKLQDLLSDLQKFSRTGLFFLSRNMLKELNDITYAEGRFKSLINYDGNRSVMHYHVTGSEVGLGTHAFKKFLLSGTKKDSLWSIDQLQLDDISLACDVLKDGGVWNINFLGARIGTALMVGLEGQYRDEDSHLDAKINLLEANLSDISTWPSLKHFLGDQRLTGEVRAVGIVYADFDRTLPRGIRLDAKMTGSLFDGSYKGFLLQDIKNMAFSYNSETGFAINEVTTGLKSINNEVEAGIFLKRASFNSTKHEIAVQGLHFDIPAHNLDWVSRHLQANFSTVISDNIATAIQSLKKDGVVQGIVDALFTTQQNGWSLRLADGVYHFMGKDHDLSNLTLEYSPFSLNIGANYKHQRQMLRLEARSIAPEFNNGEIVLSDLQRGRQQMPLIIHWLNDPDAGFYIQKMTGSISGLTFDLGRVPDAALSPDALYLSGRVDINPRDATMLMEEKLAAGILNWEIGEGYSLLGHWNIAKQEALSLEDRINFQGELGGRDFEFLGYRLYNLYAQCTYTPQAAYFRNLVVTDSCGTMQIGQIDLINKGGAWTAFSPQLIVSEFRPSFLRLARSPTPRVGKSLVIRHLEIDNLQGILGDKNSFTGYGHLAFVNPPKKNLQHTIFAIPAELLTRIGLDMAALTPVRGSIYFELKNGRASITRFKDIYSKGKLSKFNLANNGYESYVDFDGNLNLQVRMKQYNLIFKLAELFTVTVQGTLRKPTYALQKQPLQEKDKPMTVERLR